MSTYQYPLLIKQILKMPIAQASRHEIVYRGEVRLSYPQFAERVSRLGSALRALGVVHGSRVAVMDWDSNRYLENYFAVPMLGAVLMTVNIRLSPEQIAYTVDHSRAETLLIHSDFLPVLEQIRSKLPLVKSIILLSDGPADVPAGFVGGYEAMLAAADPVCDFPDFDENSQATTFYTTGTTGLPKGVMFSHRQLVLHTLSVMSTMMMAGLNGRISREDVYMPLTPMFHVHAWGFPYVATMLGMKQVYTGRFIPQTVLQLLVSEKVTISHCVPTIMHMILASPEAASIDLSGWKVLIGGSALPRAMCQAALKRGIDIFTGYGMSESCPIMTLAQLRGDMLGDQALDSEAAIDIRTSAGLPAALVEVRVVDEAMNEVPHDGHTPGEVVARSPFLTPGYDGNPDASAALWKGGWMHTGDIGAIDPNGYLRIMDRSKDVIKTGGEWISSIGLEDLLLTHKAVAEVAVIGVEDARWGERPIAVVVARPGAIVSEDELKAIVKARADTGEISKFAIPDRIVFTEALEKTSVGKLDKKAMRLRYASAPAA